MSGTCNASREYCVNSDSIFDLPTPALVLDLDRLQANLERMAAKAQGLSVSLRPHVKSHKCLEIAELQRSLGATGITVSTLYEAGVFADHGFDDITWAFPMIRSRIGEAVQLAERVRLRVVADSAETVEALERFGAPLEVLLKVDCGYHRAGVDPESETALALATSLSDSQLLTFGGLISHSGNSYHADSVAQIEAVAESERSLITKLASRLGKTGIRCETVSTGSTPAMCHVQNLAGVSEVRPGNYALFDYSQVALSSCDIADCATSVLASVVSVPTQASHSVIDAGALSLSQDPGPAGEACFGQVYADYDRATLEDRVKVTSLSQEHGILAGRMTPGQKIRILPNHSCLTTACHDEFVVVQGSRIVDRWKIWRGR